MPGSAVTTGTTITSAWGNSMPRGELGYAEVTANQGSLTSIVDLTSLTITVTTGTSRRIRIYASATFQSTVVNDRVTLRLVEDGTTVQAAKTLIVQTGQDHTIGFTITRQPSAASHTWKLQGGRENGTGTVTLIGSTSIRPNLSVEDAGAI